MLLLEEANIAMDYPALGAVTDYPAQAMPKLKYIYISPKYVANLGDEENKKLTLKIIDWHLSNCYL